MLGTFGLGLGRLGTADACPTHILIGDNNLANWLAKIVGAEIAGAHCPCRHEPLKRDAVQLIFLLAIDKENVLFFRMGPPSVPPYWILPVTAP